MNDRLIQIIAIAILAVLIFLAWLTVSSAIAAMGGRMPWDR